jgi:hypothetical protein
MQGFSSKCAVGDDLIQWTLENNELLIVRLRDSNGHLHGICSCNYYTRGLSTEVGQQVEVKAVAVAEPLASGARLRV